MGLNPSSADQIVSVNKFIDSSYDVVKAVYDNLDLIIYVSNKIDDFTWLKTEYQLGTDLYNFIADISSIPNYWDQLEAYYINRDDVTIVADNIDAITAINTQLSFIIDVANQIDNVVTVGASITKVNIVADSIDSVNTVASDINKVNTVADNIAAIRLIADDPDFFDDLQTTVDLINTNNQSIIDNKNAVDIAKASIDTTAQTIATQSQQVSDDKNQVALDKDASAQSALDAQQEADRAEGYATAINMPSDLTGQAGKIIEVKSDETGYEFVDDVQSQTPLITSAVLANWESALNLDTVETLNFTTVLYTGNGTSQNIVTGIDSVDFTVASNGSGFWLDREVNAVVTDSYIKDSGVQSTGNSNSSRVYLDNPSLFSVGQRVDIYRDTKEYQGGGIINGVLADSITVTGLSYVRANGATYFAIVGLSLGGTADWGNSARGLSKVAIKGRSDATNHIITDSLRGAGHYVVTNANNAENYIVSTVLSFNTDGFTVGVNGSVNGSGDNFVANQELYTHIKWGTTNQGKFYVEAYNPITGDGMIYYIGTGVADHRIPHSQGSPVDYFDSRNLIDAFDWVSQRRLAPLGDRLLLNETDAESNNTFYETVFESTYIGLDDGGVYNGLDDEQVLYYKRNSNQWKIVEYTGTGAAGNYVEVGFRPARVIVKRVDGVADWHLFDNKRLNISGSNDGMLQVNKSNAEVATSARLNFTDKGFVWEAGNNDENINGGDFIALVEADTNNNGGGAYYPRPTDGLLNVNGGIFNYTKGITEKGYLLSSRTVTKSYDPTGITDGFYWISENEDGTVSWLDSEPQYTYSDTGIAYKNGEWYEDGVLLNPAPSFVPKRVRVDGEAVQYIEDYLLPINVQPKTAFPEGLEVNGKPIGKGVVTIKEGSWGHQDIVDWSDTGYVLSQFDLVLCVGWFDTGVRVGITGVALPKSALDDGVFVGAYTSGGTSTSRFFTRLLNVTETSGEVTISTVSWTSAMTGIYGIYL